LYIQVLAGRILLSGKSTLFQVDLQYRPDIRMQLFVP
jgi:hypothetical protein